MNEFEPLMYELTSIEEHEKQARAGGRGGAYQRRLDARRAEAAEAAGDEEGYSGGKPKLLSQTEKLGRPVR